MMTTKEMREAGLIIVSGFAGGTEVRCYDCGTLFRESILPEHNLGEFVVCQECHGRGGYLVEKV